MPTTFCFLKSCSDREILCSIVSNGCRVGDCRTEYLGPLQAFGTCFMANRKRPRRSSEVGSVRWIEYRLGKPSYFISRAVGGQKLHIKVQETVYHPGHYRVALAMNSPTELPPDPQVTTRVFQLPASFKCRGSGNWTLKDRPKAAGSSSSRIQRTSR